MCAMSVISDIPKESVLFKEKVSPT